MRTHGWLVLLVTGIALGGWGPRTVQADSSPTEPPLPPGATIVSVQVQPKQVELSGPYEYVQLIVTGKLASGETVDLTRQAQPVAAPETVEWASPGLLRPRRAGQESLWLRVADQKVVVPVEVRAADAYQVDFVRDVAPVLSKVGCNAGTCHGSKEGKNGFKLSLRGYDYAFDHQALTDDVRGRRFNRAAPDQSLMLLKPTAAVPHVGGQVIQPGDVYYRLLRSWIAGGCQFDPNSARVVSIQLEPENPVVPLPEMKQQVRVVATYEDGSQRDVTREAVVESGNIEVLSVDGTGLLTTLRRGEAPVLARYEGAYTATTITVMGDRTGFVWHQPPVNNYIDELVYAKLQRVKVAPSDLCTDEEFVRRIYLDLTGLPPMPDQVREFLEDERPSRAKRDALIDRLVGSPDYVEYWTNKWADLLQVNRKFLGVEGAAVFRGWIENAIASNMPYDEFAQRILTASGSTLDNPAAAYWKILRDPAEAMENTTQLFLAVRFNCNKCHDHPFERWTQDQYYELASFFAQVGRKPHPDYRDQKIGGTAVEAATPVVEVIYDRNEGEVTHLRTGQTAEPVFPYVDQPLEAEGLTRREELSRWLTSPENRYFATSYVNRLWGYLLGVGLIEPIDDIRAGNPPTNPQLLERLTQDFIESGFDVQHMIRTICRSRVYQHSIQTNDWNADDQINYSHAIARRLPAEVLYDAIHAVTGSTPKIPGVPEGLRATELPDAGVSVTFLEAFGRPPRESACECERSNGVVLGPIMRLVNGPTVADALADPGNALNRLVESIDDDEALIREVFLRILARSPTDREVEVALKSLRASGEDLAYVQAKVDAYATELDRRQQEWEAQWQPDPQWRAVVPGEAHSEVGATFQIGDDGVIRAEGATGKDTYTLVLPTDLPRITALRLEALADKQLPGGGPGRAPNGNFVLSELEVAVRARSPEQDGGAQETPIKLTEATADYSQSGWNVTGAIDGNPDSGWAVSAEFGKPHTAIFATAEPVELPEGGDLVVRLVQHYPDQKHLLGRFRLSVTDAPSPLSSSQVPPEIQAVLRVPAAERDAGQLETVRAYFRKQDAKYAQLAARLELARQQAEHRRLTGVQDLAWALINTPAFLFNR